jgi:integrase
MAGYQLLKSGTKRHRFIIHRKGHRPFTKAFVAKADGERWAREQERELDVTGLPLTVDKLRKHTVKEIVTKYLNEITSTKGCRESETLVLNRFIAFAKDKSLASFTKQDAYAYIDYRNKDTSWRGKPPTPRTIAREIGSIRNVFTVARKRWGFSNLNNPFLELDLKGTKYRRKRRLLPGEMDRLQQACEKCLGLNRYYVPLAIYLAVETGMRLDEIFNLTWQDIDLENRRIEILKSKTDHATDDNGRTIVMSIMAGMFFAHLARRLVKEDAYKATNRIFPMTKDAFEQTFDDVLKRAKITEDRRGERLQFRDLRREAGQRFEDAGLTKSENELMLGHQGGDTNSIYRSPELKSIQDKLDRHFLGQTPEETQRDFARKAEDLGLTVQEHLGKIVQDFSERRGLHLREPLPVSKAAS